MKWINFEPLSDSGDKIILESALIAMSVGGCVKPLDIRGTVHIFPAVFKSGECFPICKGCDFCLPQLITFPIKSPPIPLFSNTKLACPGERNSHPLHFKQCLFCGRMRQVA